MIYAIIKDENGEVYGAEFWTRRDYLGATFSPSVTVLFMCDTNSTHMFGKTRAEKKESARQTAIAWQYAIGDFCPSYEDFAIAGDYFTAVGRRYGLLREFRENAIC